MSKRFLIITGSLTLIGLFFQWVFSGFLGVIMGLMQMGITVFFSSVLVLLIARLFGVLRKQGFPLFFSRLFLSFGALLGWLFVIIMVFSSVSNLFPAALSKIVISNGEREIIFYQMSHIATERYYREVREDFIPFAQSGYVFLIEGVRPGTSENHARFDALLGMKISSGTYDDIARFFALQAQSESLIAGIPDSALVHADVSVDDIVKTLSGRLDSLPSPVDLSLELSGIEVSPIGRFFLSSFFRGILNASLRSSLMDTDVLPAALDPDLMEAILDKRNTAIVEQYEAIAPKKSVWLYGALHFEGMYRLLRSRDTRWQIVSHEPFYPYLP